MAARCRGSASSAATASIIRYSQRADEQMTTSDSPAAQVARLAAAGQRVETPCGDGAMVWRIWGPSDGGGGALGLFPGGGWSRGGLGVHIPPRSPRFPAAVCPPPPAPAAERGPPRP